VCGDCICAVRVHLALCPPTSPWCSCRLYFFPHSPSFFPVPVAIGFLAWAQGFNGSDLFFPVFCADGYKRHAPVVALFVLPVDLACGPCVLVCTQGRLAAAGARDGPDGPCSRGRRPCQWGTHGNLWPTGNGGPRGALLRAPRPALWPHRARRQRPGHGPSPCSGGGRHGVSRRRDWGRWHPWPAPRLCVASQPRRTLPCPLQRCNPHPRVPPQGPHCTGPWRQRPSPGGHDDDGRGWRWRWRWHGGG
jgi:hypothetical protein